MVAKIVYERGLADTCFALEQRDLALVLARSVKKSKQCTKFVRAPNGCRAQERFWRLGCRAVHRQEYANLGAMAAVVHQPLKIQCKINTKPATNKDVICVIYVIHPRFGKSKGWNYDVGIEYLSWLWARDALLS
jgi:hypothetical protein